MVNQTKSSRKLRSNKGVSALQFKLSLPFLKSSKSCAFCGCSLKTFEFSRSICSDCFDCL